MKRRHTARWASFAAIATLALVASSCKPKPASQTNSADQTASMKEPAPSGRGPAFVDKDGDGVCDHWKERNNAWRGGHAGWRGMGRGRRGMGHRWRGMGQGRYGMGQGRYGMGDGWRGMGRGMRGGGHDFVDKDGDGVCDHWQGARGKPAPKPVAPVPGGQKRPAPGLGMVK